MSSLARLKMPALRLTEPPVMLPPRFKTCPSSVTMRKRLLYFLAMAMPQSISSTTTVRPSRLLKISAYRLSNCTSCDATPT